MSKEPEFYKIFTPKPFVFEKDINDDTKKDGIIVYKPSQYMKINDTIRYCTCVHLCKQFQTYPTTNGGIRCIPLYQQCPFGGQCKGSRLFANGRDVNCEIDTPDVHIMKNLKAPRFDNNKQNTKTRTKFLKTRQNTMTPVKFDMVTRLDIKIPAFVQYCPVGQTNDTCELRKQFYGPTHRGVYEISSDPNLLPDNADWKKCRRELDAMYKICAKCQAKHRQNTK